MKSREITAYSMLQVPKIKSGYQIRKCSISKINVTYPNPWHIRNPEIFQSSTIFRSLSDKLESLWKKVPDYNYFCKAVLLRPF